MPRETIHGDGGSFNVKIGWSPEPGQVQVGVTTVEGSLTDQLLRYSETMERIGQLTWERIASRGLTIEAEGDDFKSAAMRELGSVIVQVVADSTGNPNGPSDGVWASLDRAGCNAAIRVLRRARDSAFGRDE